MINRMKLAFSRYVVAIEAVAILAGVALLPGCAAINAAKTGQPLDPVAVQQDLATINYLFKATGCVEAEAGALAAPVVSIAADDVGNQVLTKTSAAGATICAMTVPATALPLPAPPSAPPVSVSVPTS